MRRLIVRILLPILFLSAFLIVCAGCLFPFEFILYLAVGWLWYLARVLPEISLNWGGVLTAIVCLAAFSLGLHRFLAWLNHQQFASDNGKTESAGWFPRWTMAIVAVVFLMFIAGISTVGLTHQATWLATSPGSIVEGGMREAVGRMQSQNNLKQTCLALHNYEHEHGTFPPGTLYGPVGRARHGWQTLLLPYVEQTQLYERINRELPWSHPDNAAAFRTPLNLFIHPFIEEREDRQGYALSHYAGNARLLGGDTGWSISQITDGLSNTIMAGEVNARFKPWGHPRNCRDPALGVNTSPDGFGSWSPSLRVPSKGANFVFADGSVHWIKNSASPEVMKALSTPNGNDKIELDDE